MSKLVLSHLKKEYENGTVVAVDNIDLTVEKGETIALLGSSGCGKSTTLNMVVGLETPTAGDIRIDGKSIVNVPAGKRNVGLVFQDYAVFSAMTVKKNLAFGLEVRRRPKAEVARAVDEVAELLGMTDKLNARARDLGGSELQRVAIGRTLVTRPDILLLDEPLSNLEAAARLAMRRELRRLQSEIGLTIIYVTHDQVEALSLADRIAVMDHGRILQVEQTSRICEQPAHIFVAGFLGSPPMNLITGRFLKKQDAAWFESTGFSIPLGNVAEARTLPDGLHTAGIRPESITLAPPENAALAGEVTLVEPRGPETIVTIACGPGTLKAVVPSGTPCAPGRRVGLETAPETFVFFNNNTNHRVNIQFGGETKK